MLCSHAACEVYKAKCLRPVNIFHKVTIKDNADTLCASIEF